MLDLPSKEGSMQPQNMVRNPVSGLDCLDVVAVCKQLKNISRFELCRKLHDEDGVYIVRTDKGIRYQIGNVKKTPDYPDSRPNPIPKPQTDYVMLPEETTEDDIETHFVYDV